MPHGGLLFETRWKKRRMNRPDVVILCDVSRSMSTVVRFCLLMLYGLNEVVARIRSFVFCSSLVEVSHVFESAPIAEAVERLRTGAAPQRPEERSPAGRPSPTGVSI